MDLTTRKALTQGLAKLSGEIAAGLRPAVLPGGEAEERGRALFRAEHAGGDYDRWTELLARRAAVLWVLKSLYVRVLEDRGLLRPGRLLDPESEHLFAHMAPDLGPTAYLRWVFRDLASPRGGLPELFAPQPAEVVRVPDPLSRKLLDFWRARDPDTGAVRYRFDDERFDSRLLGDLYQDLDPVVKKRYALLQTPDFVLDFILDETLTPAIAEHGPEVVRVLDPACGSGHFLLAAFGRLVAAMRAKYPERPAGEVVNDVLGRVVGIDLNDYACGLARARLVMTALEATGQTELSEGRDLHPKVFWADALEQVEADEQLDLVVLPKNGSRVVGMLTPEEVRSALRPELKQRFHVVVGNPPYITEKDASKREYHKQKVGKRRRYVSAAGKYSLGAPFTERMLQLATDGGWVGEITADSFMKREFGKALITEVLAKKDLFKVVATSGAFIPGHGTPTVILFARNRPPQGQTVRVVMGKRGEPGKPADPAKGRVWLSIREGQAQAKFENEFISVADVERATMNAPPWSIGGGGAAELKEAIEETAGTLLGRLAVAGVGGMSNADDVYIEDALTFERWRVEPSYVRPLVLGDEVRDWGHSTTARVFFPYDAELALVSPTGPTLHAIWPFRTTLWARAVFSGGTYRAAGRPWFEWHQVTADRYRTPLTMTFGEVATHNHFVLDRGGKVFKQTAPVIKLPAGAKEDQHLVLLAQLNSSTACFWLKQVCQDKGIRGEGGGFTPDEWERFFQFGSTKLESFPLAVTDPTAHPDLTDFARRLDALARERVADSPAAVLATHATLGPAALRTALEDRRTRDLDRLFQMVGLQEELDWLCYRLYKVDPDLETRSPAEVPPLRPGLRPFEITLAQEDAERRAALARGEDPDEQPTQWFERHGWEPHPTPDALPEPERALVLARIERTQASRELCLLEQPTFKRRWYNPEYEKEEREALALWIADRLEAWARERKEPFTAAQIASALRSDPGVLAAGEMLEGRPDFDVDELLTTLLRKDAVPHQKHHVFTEEGLRKRAQWERTWQEQHKEDRGEPAAPEVPEKYDAKDYLRPEYWSLRGKLDVPKERFLAFTEVPPPIGEPLLYAWAGWTHRERARALLALDEKLENAGVKVPDRLGVLWGAQFLLPYVAWESKSAAADLWADIKSLVGEQGVTDALLQEWAQRFPPPTRSGARGKTKAKGKTS